MGDQRLPGRREPLAHEQARHRRASLRERRKGLQGAFAAGGRDT
jgi:hypothetical protein